MRSFYITFLFFLTLGNAFAANYYEDAQSKYDLKDFKSSIQLLEKEYRISTQGLKVMDIIRQIVCFN